MLINVWIDKKAEARKDEWRKWFAWRPVLLDRSDFMDTFAKMAWLEIIEKRRYWRGPNPNHPMSAWEYRRVK